MNADKIAARKSVELRPACRSVLFPCFSVRLLSWRFMKDI